MKRLIIIGCGGAGKTTLAKKLHQILLLPLIHLDYHYWQSGWREPTKAQWESIVQNLIAGECWIMDGNYGGTLDLRAAKADTIIFLDFNRFRCLWGIFRRWYRFRGRTRPDLPDGCPERISWQFVHYIWNYRRTRKPRITMLLKQYEQNDTKIHVFQKPKEINSWLTNLEKKC